MKIDQNTAGSTVRWLEITEENHGQRLDNFLLSLLKGVPKSRIYRIVRKGEVRVNKGRCAAKLRLQQGDIVRIPPIRTAQQPVETFVPEDLKNTLENNVLFEDEVLIVLNKPSGYAVHGGSGIQSGIIECLRQIRPDANFLELVHRLDRDTSGCLMIAKKRSALKNLHALFRDDSVQKAYMAILVGKWARKKLWVREPLQKNVRKGGERMVVVSPSGKASETLFRRMKIFNDSTLVEVMPKTGRTHQIRVHAAWLGHAIVGDDRYGQENINRKFKQKGYGRLCLHAQKLEFQHPVSGQMLSIQAPLPATMEQMVNRED